ncbi:twin-arginine translocation signal domain-containing protein [Streptomyces sp. ST2-7A]|uniref:twin-arginine translocation signal domain-containing protein n=1 Tax=Streptomyces sp. ST2-7A TaxID=2907214 RepID=UPI001F454134|nr:twin-arginine translocation signal domain-containing protein [Streptomyces sp. ST2-7A]MCE7080758.1 twin-arginine translocation signal domain-containing protein [Streptomyces sp. ST2-7A]
MSETTRRGFLGLAAATAGAAVTLPVLTAPGALAAEGDSPLPDTSGAAGPEARGSGIVTRADHPNAEFAPDGWPGDHPEPLNAAVSCSLPDGFDDGGEVHD